MKILHLVRRKLSFCNFMPDISITAMLRACKNVFKSKLCLREITLFLQSVVFVTTDAALAFVFVPSKT
jgi:hypothetical protein